MPEITEDHVREQLKQVIDPELFVNIVDLGLIYVVDLKAAAETGSESGTESGADSGAEPDPEPSPAAADLVDVTIEMTMTSPACPAGPQLIANSKQVVSNMEQVHDVEVKLVMDPPWTPDRMTEDAKDQLGIF